MRRLVISAVSILCFLVLQGHSTAEMYKWVDENGQMHFTNMPPQNVPPSRNVEKVEPKGAVSILGTGQQNKEPSEKRSFEFPFFNLEPKQEKNEHQVELYVTSWCPYCKKAREFFQSRGISYTEYDIEKDKEAARRKRRLDGRKGVPFAVINGQKVHGYSEAAYVRALKVRP